MNNVINFKTAKIMQAHAELLSIQNYIVAHRMGVIEMAKQDYSGLVAREIQLKGQLYALQN